jgi:hypothetical protein
MYIYLEIYVDIVYVQGHRVSVEGVCTSPSRYSKYHFHTNFSSTFLFLLSIIQTSLLPFSFSCQSFKLLFFLSLFLLSIIQTSLLPFSLSLLNSSHRRLCTALSLLSLPNDFLSHQCAHTHTHMHTHSIWEYKTVSTASQTSMRLTPFAPKTCLAVLRSQVGGLSLQLPVVILERSRSRQTTPPNLQPPSSPPALF